MAFDPFSLGATALGIGGSLLMGGDDDTDALLRRLRQQSQTGVGVQKLAAPGVGAVNTAFSDASRRDQAASASRGLSGTSLQNVNIADLFQKRAKGLGDVFAQATAQNEASKQRAQAQLLGLLGMRSSQQNVAQSALGQLTGAGIQGMLRGFMNQGNVGDPFKKQTFGDFGGDEFTKFNFRSGFGG